MAVVFAFDFLRLWEFQGKLRASCFRFCLMAVGRLQVSLSIHLNTPSSILGRTLLDVAGWRCSLSTFKVIAWSSRFFCVLFQPKINPAFIATQKDLKTWNFFTMNWVQDSMNFMPLNLWAGGFLDMSQWNWHKFQWTKKENNIHVTYIYIICKLY